MTKWKTPTGLDRSRPREVRLTAAGVALLAFSGALFIGSIPAFIAVMGVAAEQAEEDRALRENGRDIDAVITDLWRGSGEGNPRWVAYRFSPPGDPASFENRVKIPRRVWESLSVGSNLPVRFDPNNPELNVLRGFEPAPLPVWLAPLTAVGLVSLGLVLMLPIRNQRRMLSEGRSAAARVTAHKKADKGSIAQYEFRILSGALRKGSSSVMKKLPAVGSTISVLYDPERTHRQAVYPLSLVRLAER